MYSELELGGQVYPIKFGINAVRLYCNKFDITLSKIGKFFAEENLTLDSVLYLALYGLKDGHRVAKVAGAFTLTVEDIADFMDEDPDLPQKVISTFTEQFDSKKKGSQMKQKTKRKGKS